MSEKKKDQLGSTSKSFTEKESVIEGTGFPYCGWIPWIVAALGVAIIAIILGVNLKGRKSSVENKTTKVTESGTKPVKPEMTEVLESSTEINFALRLLDACSDASQSSTENIVISPVSIFTAMGMVGLGSEGNTKQEFLNVFGDEYQQHAVWQVKALERMQSQITVANAIFQTGDVLEKFKKDLKDSYKAEIRDDMTKDAINTWCFEKTNNKIKEIIQEDLDSNTIAVIVSAIYLNAKWKESFDRTLLRTGKFNHGIGEYDVTYMKKKSIMNYLDDSLFQAVGLPYEGDLEMVVVLPKPSSSLAAVIYKFASDGQIGLENFKSEEVSLSLPKMKLSFRTEMAAVLRKLGLVDAFTLGASFPRISNTQVYISNVYHKVIMNVDEDGTEAAAATGAEVDAKGGSPAVSKTMEVNRPFLVILRTTSGHPVFMASVKKPI